MYACLSFLCDGLGTFVMGTASNVSECVWMLWVHPKNVQVLTMLFPCILYIKVSLQTKICIYANMMHKYDYTQIYPP